jgi:imidazoleglycerol-phosphate dehydratase/histidinol-phosphatase
MKKVLFIDRDGTLIKEFPPKYQIDSFKKIIFYPKVIYYLSKIANNLNYKLIMVTNQDFLGTEKFPEKKFWYSHNHIIRTFEGEKVYFSEIYININIPEDYSYMRKPGIGMLINYLSKYYNITNSFVIGDRITDVFFAKNLGCYAIWINKKNNIKKLKNNIFLKTKNWKKIYKYLKFNNYRKSIINRKTLETDINIILNIDGKGRSKIYTGLGFFDHMLNQVAFHGNLDLNIFIKGDLDIDEHHTIEDTGIALGEAFYKALGNKKGIERYGSFFIVMDDCLTKFHLDFGGRSYFFWKVKFFREKIGQFPTEMFYHFFKSFSNSSLCNIHIQSKGKNEHHKIESIFKAFGKSIKIAINFDKKKNNKLPTTKGKL